MLHPGLVKAFAKVFEIPEESVRPEMDRFSAFPRHAWDSMRQLELILEVERITGVNFTTDYYKANSVEKMNALLIREETTQTERRAKEAERRAKALAADPNYPF